MTDKQVTKMIQNNYFSVPVKTAEVLKHYGDDWDNLISELCHLLFSRHCQQHCKVRQQGRRPGSLHHLQLPAGRAHRQDRLQDRRQVAQRAQHERRGRRVDGLRAAERALPDLAAGHALAALQREPRAGPARDPVRPGPLVERGAGADPDLGLLQAVQGRRDHDHEHGETEPLYSASPNSIRMLPRGTLAAGCANAARSSSSSRMSTRAKIAGRDGGRSETTPHATTSSCR